MRKISFLPIFLVLLLTSIFAQSNIPVTVNSNSNEFVGEYIYSNGYVGATYKIKSDGNFEYYTFSDCCDPVWRESGSYILKDNQLHLKISQKTLNKYNLLDAKQATEAYRKLYDYKGEDFKDDKIKTEYEIQIVKWGTRVYLIPLEQLHSFAAAVNLRVEPRQDIIDGNFLTFGFYLRRGDEKKAVSGNPMLPEKYASYLQDSPIKASITKIELEDKKKTYTINKGSANGIKIGMAFIGENAEVEYDDILWVISVEANSAKAQTFHISRPKDYQIDNVLTTKIVK